MLFSKVAPQASNPQPQFSHSPLKVPLLTSSPLTNNTTSAFLSWDVCKYITPLYYLKWANVSQLWPFCPKSTVIKTSYGYQNSAEMHNQVEEIAHEAQPLKLHWGNLALKLKLLWKEQNYSILEHWILVNWGFETRYSLEEGAFACWACLVFITAQQRRHRSEAWGILQIWFLTNSRPFGHISN